MSGRDPVGPVDPSMLERWITERRPPVPGGFAEWMRPSGAPEVDEGAEGVFEALAAEAEAALRRSLAPEDRPRGGAFDLLAADGFLTWAAEAALDLDDPGAALDRLVERFAG